MWLKTPKKPKMTAADAEALAASALALIAEDPARINRFLTESGLSPGDLMARAADRDILAAVLDHVCSDESLLLLFAAEKQLTPEQVVAAQEMLGGRRPEYSP